MPVLGIEFSDRSPAPGYEAIAKPKYQKYPDLLQELRTKFFEANDAISDLALNDAPPADFVKPMENYRQAMNALFHVIKLYDQVPLVCHCGSPVLAKGDLMLCSSCSKIYLDLSDERIKTNGK
jgi:hypothetical protein